MSDREVNPHEEIWVPAIDWPQYKVSSLGNLRRIYKNHKRPLKAHKSKNGYMNVTFSSPQKTKCVHVHRVVYESFNGKQLGLDICHNDGIKTNNCLSNLRADTRAGNMADVYKHDTHIRGERCGMNKYPTEKILAFKQELKTGISIRQAAIKHNIPCPTGYAIASKRIWSWLEV